MHIKFLSHGRGSGKDAVQYLLAEVDHRGKVRAEVNVLRGNPSLVADVVDSLEFKNRYTSGVIAWSPEDKPSDGAINAVLNDFEELSFPGLEQTRTSWAAIKHCDHDGGVHVHIIVARVDLETGKSLNIAPPGWQKDFDPLRDYHNYQNDWARPDDPSRSRLFQPGHPLFLKKGDNPKQVLTDYLVHCIEAGVVANRDDVKAQLATVGKITRDGKNYISIKPIGFSKAVRLKGGIYDEKFDARADKSVGKENPRRSNNGQGNSKDRAEEARRIFERAVEKRRTYNTKRYEKSRTLNPASIERVGITEHKSEKTDYTARAHFPGSAGAIWTDLGCGAGSLGFLPDQNSNEFRRQDKQPKTPLLQHGTESIEIKEGGDETRQSEIEAVISTGHRTVAQRRGVVSHFQRQNEKQTRIVPEYRGAVGRKTNFEVKNVRDKKLVSDSISGFASNIQQGHREFMRSNAILLSESRKLINAGDQFRKATKRVLEAGKDLIRTIDQSIKKLIVRNAVLKAEVKLSRSRNFSR